MRIAVLSDVHGNLSALEAVLADAGNVDLVVANGDLLAYGPQPEETLTLLRSLPNVRFVNGNNDRYLAERRWEADPADGWEAEAFANLHWTATAIGAEGIEFLRQWPFDLRIELQTPVRVVHASPLADNIGMFPWTPDTRLDQMVRDIAEPVVVCGHTHLVMDRQLGHHRIVSDGSAGFPLDRDLRPSYLLVDDAQGHLNIQAHRVPYDIETAIREVEARHVPFGQVIVYQMRHAALMPRHETDYARTDLLHFAE